MNRKVGVLQGIDIYEEGSFLASEHTLNQLALANTMVKDYEKLIAELQEKVHSLEEAEQYNAKCFADAKDKLHRRNLQIAELKKKIKSSFICDSCGDYIV